LKNKTRRRLGFAMMILAVATAVYNLQSRSSAVMLGTPVVFLAAGAVLLRKTRSSTLPR
jgi:inner membrane protein involved in colicin E2 resistance